MTSRERPPAGTGGHERLAGGLQADRTRVGGDAPPITHPLPFDPIHEATMRGFGLGWAARQPEVDRLNAEADRLYVRQWSPPKRERIVRQRMDGHFAAEDRRFFRGGGDR